MSKLLRIDSSPMIGYSVSSELTEAYTATWQATHPDGRVISRDLTNTPLAPIDAKWIMAMATPDDGRTEEQKALLRLSDELIAELHDADEYAIGVPMHNFNIPSTIKLWIDLVTRSGKTFAVEAGASRGLLAGKKVTFLLATGLEYGAGSPIASMNHAEPYLRTIFVFWGVTEITFLTAGGTSVLRQGADRAEFLAPHLRAVESHLQPA